jgi:8-oxo-dGTP diphosphatase
MCLYTSDEFTGTQKECDEGELEWVPKEKLEDLNMWPGDRIFNKLIREDAPFFSLKLSYQGDELTEVILNGKEAKTE